MRIQKQPLKNLLLLVSTSLISGCFDTAPSSSPSSSAPKPLKQTRTEPFKLPEGVTEIQSVFSEADTPDWGNPQNWTTDFYKNGEDAGYDYFHKFVPCRAPKVDIPTHITIQNGTCFVNESVDISGLKMTWDTRLTIPRGVVVKSAGNLDIKKATIDGGGDFYVSGKPQTQCTGSIRLNIFHAPEVIWCGDTSADSFEVNQGKLHTLVMSKIYVKDRLDVADIILSDKQVINIHHLHIARNDRRSANLGFHVSTRSFNIDLLSFDPGTRVNFGNMQEIFLDKAESWQPIRLRGTLDVTQLNPVHSALFKHAGTIGEKIPLFIPEKGIVGDPNILRKHRRAVVSGYFDDFPREYMDSSNYVGAINLIWVDDTQVYWQRSATPMPDTESFLLWNDASLMKLAQENPGKSKGTLLGIDAAKMDQVNQISKTLYNQRKHIHDHATEAGIERYLAVQITPDAKERVLKLLSLVDIQPYLDEHTMISEAGEQAVVDSLVHFNTPGLNQPYGLHGINRSFISSGATNVGLSLNASTYSLSGAFYQSQGTAQAPWAMGIDYRANLSPNLWGVVRATTGGADAKPLTLSLKSGLGLSLSPVSQVTLFAGSKGMFGKGESAGSFSGAHPINTVYSLETGVEWSTRLGAHEFRVSGDVSYQPHQQVTVRIADLDVVIDNLTIESTYSIKSSVGYVYSPCKGVQWLGDITLNSDERQPISAKIGFKVER